MGHFVKLEEILSVGSAYLQVFCLPATALTLVLIVHWSAG
jgi:hypothetical protein